MTQLGRNSWQMVWSVESPGIPNPQENGNGKNQLVRVKHVINNKE